MRVVLAVVEGLAALTALAGTSKGLVIVLGTILLGASEGSEGRPRASSFLFSEAVRRARLLFSAFWGSQVRASR